MKALTKSQIKLLGTIGTLGFKEPSAPEPRSNLYTGATHVLTPTACKVYDFVTVKYLVCGRDHTREDWDNARYLFLAQWPKEYMDLLD